ncbi:MAG: hypothetical protein ACLRXP_16285 [Oscillospiraceae bacterium]
MYSNEEKLKAAYAFNLCTVSVSQIVDYADINIMEQEANTILNNLNLERMPNADALRDILTQILDTTAFCRLQEKDKEMIDREYQHQVKNAVWNSIPRLGMIFASGNSAAMALTLATQVGIGYMNYRRTRQTMPMPQSRKNGNWSEASLNNSMVCRKLCSVPHGIWQRNMNSRMNIA